MLQGTGRPSKCSSTHVIELSTHDKILSNSLKSILSCQANRLDQFIISSEPQVLIKQSTLAVCDSHWTLPLLSPYILTHPTLPTHLANNTKEPSTILRPCLFSFLKSYYSLLLYESLFSEKLSTRKVF
jgi:hypothetical protein